MKYIFSLFFCVISIFGAIHCRIIGGTVVTDITAYLFIASLRTTGGSHFCAGSIISPKWILSAAHCFPKSIEPFVAVVGSHQLNAGGVSYSVSQIFIHSLYDESKFINDIALLKLEISINDNSLINSIELPDGIPFTDPSVIDSVLLGWGNTDPDPEINAISNDLLKLIMNVVQSDQCNYPGFEAETQLCMDSTSGTGGCVGDSGGPLIYKDKLIGIVSYGGFPCGNHPTVFTNVSKYLAWIQQTIHNNTSINSF